MTNFLNVHIIYAHPESKSFVAAMRNTIISHFEEEGCNVTISDLYAKKFNPIVSEKDFLDRSDKDYLGYSLEQRHGLKTDTLALDIAEEIEFVLKADLLVFIFPLFWFGVPAILKGWIERVFISGLFYGGKRIYGKGGLRGKRVFTAFSLGGRDHMFGPDAIHGELTGGMLKHFFQGTLGYVGLDVLEPYIAYHVPYVSDADRHNMLDELKATLVNIDQQPLLPMPDLARFSDTFEPVGTLNDTYRRT